MGFVLIVEPDEVNASRIRTILDSIETNFEYELAVTTDRGIDLVEERQPDVFIGDMELPIVTGKEFFTMVEMMSPETVRILITESGKVEETVSFMNECRVFKVIMKPCRIAEDLLEPIEAAFHYKKIQTKSRQDAAGFLTGSGQLMQMQQQVTRNLADSSRIRSVFTELFRCNLAFGKYSPEIKAALEYWYAWMMEQCEKELLISDAPFAVRARELLAEYHIPDERYLMKINANHVQAIDLKAAGILSYLIRLMAEPCKSILIAYQISIMVESVQQGHILRLQCVPFRSGGAVALKEKNPAVRAATKRAVETGMMAFGFKCAAKPNGNSILVNIAVPR